MAEDESPSAPIDEIQNLRQEVLESKRVIGELAERVRRLESEPRVVRIDKNFGEIVMSSEKTVNVTGSKNVSIADDHSTATVTVHSGPKGEFLSRDDVVALLNTAQSALDKEAKKLDEIHGLAYEGLSNLLLEIRKIRADQITHAELQKRAHDTLDDLWAKQVVKGMKPVSLDATLETIKALAPVIGPLGVKLLT